MNEEGDMQQIAERILEDVLENPEIAALIDTMLADPRVTREQLFHTAFAQGVMSAICLLREGRLIDLSSN